MICCVSPTARRHLQRFAPETSRERERNAGFPGQAQHSRAAEANHCLRGVGPPAASPWRPRSRPIQRPIAIFSDHRSPSPQAHALQPAARIPSAVSRAAPRCGILAAAGKSKPRLQPALPSRGDGALSRAGRPAGRVAFLPSAPAGRCDRSEQVW